MHASNLSLPDHAAEDHLKQRMAAGIHPDAPDDERQAQVAVVLHHAAVCAVHVRSRYGKKQSPGSPSMRRQAQ